MRSSKGRRAHIFFLTQQVWCLLMESFSVILSRLWGIYVTSAVMTGCWITNVNTHNTSLLYAWMVSLCDLVYIMDALTRTSKRVYRSTTSADFTLLFNCTSPFFIFKILMIPLKIITFTPYHVLVILELDESDVYLVVCVIRVTMLLLSGRFHVASALSKARKYGRLHAAQKSKGAVNAIPRQAVTKKRE